MPLYIFPGDADRGRYSVAVFPRVSTSSDWVSFANLAIISSIWIVLELPRNLILTRSFSSNCRSSSVTIPFVSPAFPTMIRGLSFEARFFSSGLLGFSGLPPVYIRAPWRAFPHEHGLGSDILGITSARSFFTLSMLAFIVLTTSSLSTTRPVIQQS